MLAFDTDVVALGWGMRLMALGVAVVSAAAALAAPQSALASQSVSTPTFCIDGNVVTAPETCSYTPAFPVKVTIAERSATYSAANRFVIHLRLTDAAGHAVPNVAGAIYVHWFNQGDSPMTGPHTWLNTDQDGRASLAVPFQRSFVLQTDLGMNVSMAEGSYWSSVGVDTWSYAPPSLSVRMRPVVTSTVNRRGPSVVVSAPNGHLPAYVQRLSSGKWTTVRKGTTVTRAGGGSSLTFASLPKGAYRIVLPGSTRTYNTYISPRLTKR